MWACAASGRRDPSRPVGLDDDLRAQFASLGVDTATLPQPAAPPVTEVWSCNWPAFRLFVAARSCWRAAGTFGGVGYLGLDYAGVEIVERRLRLPPVEWADLQVMEDAALAIFNSGDP